MTLPEPTDQVKNNALRFLETDQFQEMLQTYRRLDSPRVDAASEPYPGRWTHHIVIGSAEEIDGEVMEWIREAAEFSSRKR